MSLFEKPGSKERLVEMMKIINKVDLSKDNTTKKVINEASGPYDMWGRVPSKSRTEESFDSPQEKDEEYLDKTVDPQGNQDNKFDGGVDYPANDKLKVDDPALDKVAETDEEPSNDENPEMETPEPANPNGEMSLDVDNIEMDGDQMDGGLADKSQASEFDPQQILKGIEVELGEHTNNPRLALEIAMDHLKEEPQYYGSNEENPDQMAMVGAQEDAAELPIDTPAEEMGGEESHYEDLTAFNLDSEKEMEDELLGFKPKNVGQ